MKRFFTTLAILILTLAVDADSQQAGKQIEVTGVVKGYCQQEDGLYRFHIQLRVRNVGASPLIIPKADAIQKHGRVWRRSLESQPIAFVVSITAPPNTHLRWTHR